MLKKIILNMACLMSVLAQGAGHPIDAIGADGRTVLTRAILGQSLEGIRLALDAGANVNQVDDFGSKPFLLAVNESTVINLKITKMLLTKNIAVPTLVEAIDYIDETGIDEIEWEDFLHAIRIKVLTDFPDKANEARVEVFNHLFNSVVSQSDPVMLDDLLEDMILTPAHVCFFIQEVRSSGLVFGSGFHKELTSLLRYLAEDKREELLALVLIDAPLMHPVLINIFDNIDELGTDYSGESSDLDLN